MTEYEKAQICENGHIISMNRSSFTTDKRCSKCGDNIIDSCPKCNAPIKGEPKNLKSTYCVKIKPPMYCGNCGAPYPWTERTIKAEEEIKRLEEDFSI